MVTKWLHERAKTPFFELLQGFACSPCSPFAVFGLK